MSQARRSLLDRLRRDALKTGQFVLASGRASDYLIDCKRVVLTAEGHRLVAEAFCEVLREETFDVVAGVALGGCPLASAVAFYSSQQGLGEGHGWDAVYVRKEPKGYGSAGQIEGLRARDDRAVRAVLLEDVLTTGGSSRKAIATLRAAGVEVTTVWSLVDREEGAVAALAEDGVTAKSLFRREDFFA